MPENRSVEFFDAQFRRQVEACEYSLNPFEQAALPYVSGRVLELGCGLGNLAIEAARRGCTVVAVDASPTAVARLAHAVRDERLSLEAIQSDLGKYAIRGPYDTVVAIGLVMFFTCDEAGRMLADMRRAVAPGGHAVVNTLIEGTTWLDALDPDRHCLFPEGALERSFEGWTTALARRDEFPAPGGKLKRFDTVVAQRPCAATVPG